MLYIKIVFNTLDEYQHSNQAFCQRILFTF